MKKTNKLSTSIAGHEASVERIVEKNLTELQFESDKNAQFWVGTFDFISGGKFSQKKDNIQFKIWQNRLKIFTESRKIIEKADLEIYPLNLRLQNEFVKNANLEENETLQQKWVNLLANAATKKVDVKVRYTKILSELSELDVFILDTLFEKNGNMSIRDFESKAGLDELKVVLDSLFANQLIKSPVQNPDTGYLLLGDSGPDYEFEIEGKTYSDFSLTPLGSAFVQACKFDL